MPAKVRPVPWRLVAFAVVGALALAAAALLPVSEWTDVIEDWIEHLDFGTGLLIFGALYFVATLLLVPELILPVAAGALFGLAWGLAVATSAAMASAIAAFLVARHLLLEPMRRFARRYSTFAAVEKAMESKGWKMVALLRLSPVLPFGVKNYLLGTTRVALGDYALGTLAGILPGLLFKVYVGWAGRFALGGEGEPLEWALSAAGLVATAAVAYIVGRMAKARLKRVR
jgi:uncharacterized membrane protein YdjX (TVP38/TMEM64 family)